MLDYIKKLFSFPRNFEDQKSSDYGGYKFTAIFYLLTSLCIFGVIYKKWNLAVYSKEKILFYITLANCIGFGISSIIFYRYSKSVKKTSTVSEIQKIKLSAYYAFGLIVGIPYMLMTAWLFLNRDYPGGAVLLAIYSSSCLVIYFYDWKTFLKYSSSFALSATIFALANITTYF